jgi:hypothetical protein
VAYLAAGYTNRGDRPFAKTVSRGLRWLKDRQASEGTFGASARDRALAALALVMAYARTESPIYRDAAHRGLAALAPPQPGGQVDPLTLGATVLALAEATAAISEAESRGKHAPWEVRAGDLDAARRTLDRMAGPGDDAAAVVSLVGRAALGGPRDPAAEAAKALTAPGACDPIRTWLASLLLVGTVTQGRLTLGEALCPLDRGSEAWRAWCREVVSSLSAAQHAGAACDQGGSWDPPPGSDLPGGRVGATALAAMTMGTCETYAGR